MVALTGGAALVLSGAIGGVALDRCSRKEATEEASTEAGPAGLRVCSNEIQEQTQRVYACLENGQAECQNLLSVAGEPDAGGTFDVSAALGALKQRASFACADLGYDNFALHQGSPWTISVDRLDEASNALYTRGSTVILNDGANSAVPDRTMAAILLTAGKSVLTNQRDREVDEMGTVNRSDWAFGNPLMTWLTDQGSNVTTIWAASKVYEAMISNDNLAAPKLDAGQDPTLKFIGNGS